MLEWKGLLLPASRGERPIIDSGRTPVAYSISSTTAHRASLFCQHKATENSENATSLRSTIAGYHAHHKYTERIPPYSGPAAVVSHHSHDVSVALAILLLKNHQNEAEYIIIIHLRVIFHL